MEFVAKVKGNPERERKPVVMLTPPVVEKSVMLPAPVVRLTPPVLEKFVRLPVDVLDEEGDSDDLDRDRIVLQRLKVKLEVDRLAKYEEAYALKMERRS